MSLLLIIGGILSVLGSLFIFYVQRRIKKMIKFDEQLRELFEASGKDVTLFLFSYRESEFVGRSINKQLIMMRTAVYGIAWAAWVFMTIGAYDQFHL